MKPSMPFIIQDICERYETLSWRHSFGLPPSLVFLKEKNGNAEKKRMGPCSCIMWPKTMQVNYAQVKAAKEMKETPVFWNLLFVRYIERTA